MITGWSNEQFHSTVKDWQRALLGCHQQQGHDNAQHAGAMHHALLRLHAHLLVGSEPIGHWRKTAW